MSHAALAPNARSPITTLDDPDPVDRSPEPSVPSRPSAHERGGSAPLRVPLGELAKLRSATR